MELQALLVLCGLGVAGAAVILLMGLFSTSGTTYEEAIAQQRKATTELLALAENKGKAKKTSKKANKKVSFFKTMISILFLYYLNTFLPNGYFLIIFYIYNWHK